MFPHVYERSSLFTGHRFAKYLVAEAEVAALCGIQSKHIGFVYIWAA